MILNRRKLISSREAVEAKCQHDKPCSDCPWARDSLHGWLGGFSPDTWTAAAHGEEVIWCHMLIGAQCAGAAIYRANVAKNTRSDQTLRLPKDPKMVFNTPFEFWDHHTIAPRKDKK